MEILQNISPTALRYEDSVIQNHQASFDSQFRPWVSEIPDVLIGMGFCPHAIFALKSHESGLYSFIKLLVLNIFSGLFFNIFDIQVHNTLRLRYSGDETQITIVFVNSFTNIYVWIPNRTSAQRIGNDVCRTFSVFHLKHTLGLKFLVYLHQRFIVDIK